MPPAKESRPLDLAIQPLVRLRPQQQNAKAAEQDDGDLPQGVVRQAKCGRERAEQDRETGKRQDETGHEEERSPPVVLADGRAQQDR